LARVVNSTTAKNTAQCQVLSKDEMKWK